MDIRRIQWQETIALRHEVLWPNEEPRFCHVEGDEQGWHFGGYVEDGLVSVASVYAEGSRARLRKFATAKAFQRRGIGTRMLEHILTELAKNNIDYFWCDARESATGIYQQFNMAPEGSRFYKGHIPYIKMAVSLNQTSVTHRPTSNP